MINVDHRATDRLLQISIWISDSPKQSTPTNSLTSAYWSATSSASLLPTALYHNFQKWVCNFGFLLFYLIYQVFWVLLFLEICLLKKFVWSNTAFEICLIKMGLMEMGLFKMDFCYFTHLFDRNGFEICFFFLQSIFLCSACVSSHQTWQRERERRCLTIEI